MKTILLLTTITLFSFSVFAQYSIEEIMGQSTAPQGMQQTQIVKSAKGPVGIPFFTGFETGVLDTCFTYSASTGSGRYLILQDSTSSGPTTTSPVTGLYYLAMDCSVATYNQNDLDLHLDLTGETEVLLNFWWMDYQDETHAQEGVSISDDNGMSFTQIIPLAGELYTDLQWTNFQIDLDSAATANGLSLNSSFIIRFTQYDNYWIHGGGDGHFYDDIHVFDPVITDIKESQDKNTISVFPNPVKDACSVSYSIEEASNVQITLVDITGRQLYDSGVFNKQQGRYIEKLDFANYAEGIYFVNIAINQELTTLKIVK